MAITNTRVGSIKNDGSTILGAGSVSDSTINPLDVTQISDIKNTGSKVVLAVSPTESGNLGTWKPISAGVFANTAKDQYTATIIGTHVAGLPNTILQTPAEIKRNPLDYGRGYERLNITSVDYYTGSVTYGPNAGQHVGYWSPIDGISIDHEDFPTDLVPGEFTYMNGALTPVMADYPSR